MADTFHCPRGPGPGSPYQPPFDGVAHWRDDGACSYCGSFSEAAFFAAVEAGAELGPTDKNYKVYLRGEGVPHVKGAAKFYFQHLSEEGQARFIALYNGKRMNIGYPGNFYVPPFFCAPV
jgi:hypothetical protein